MKLFILDNLSAFSSDTVFKICLSLEERGLQEENIERFDSYDTLFEAAAVALENGEHVIVASETVDFVAVKNALIPYLSLQGAPSSDIAEVIAKNAGDNDETDMEGHSMSPIGAIPLLSEDGLFSGFSTLVYSGRLTCLPLDFTRVDALIATLVDQIISREETLAEMGVQGEIQMPDFDLIPAVSDMVNALYKSNKTIALCTGEATMWIYNLYDQIDYLTDTLKFADVTDSEEPEDSNESAAVIAKAREAMMSIGTDFGGAVSEIYSSYNEDGNISYYAFAAVVDGETAGAKKININDPTNLSIMLPHAVTLLSDIICKKLKAEERKTQQQEPANTGKKEPVVVTPKMIGIIAALLIAIIIPLVLVFNMIGGKEEPTTTTLPTLPPPSSTTEVSTTKDPFAITPTDPTVLNNEPGATDVTASSTAAPQPSSKGLFTFYVFGYGHGVGMSQTGANYLANQGWSWAEILAHYYYDPNTKIIQGDVYPDKITYAGAEYETREYLARALESEMGPSFHTEALKAQCIAIYTFAKHNKYKLDADATAFTATSPSSTVYKVVDDVMNEGFYIANADGVALTPFHAMSAGKTTSYYNVWGKNSETHVSYLAGGRKSYGDYLDDEYKSVYTITSDDLKKLIESNDSLKVNLSGDPSTWLTILTHDQAVREDIGYVSTINVGGMVLTGNDFRIKVMEGRIRSHCFALQYTPM